MHIKTQNSELQFFLDFFNIFVDFFYIITNPFNILIDFYDFRFNFSDLMRMIFDVRFYQSSYSLFYDKSSQKNKKRNSCECINNSQYFSDVWLWYNITLSHRCHSHHDKIKWIKETMSFYDMKKKSSANNYCK